MKFFTYLAILTFLAAFCITAYAADGAKIYERCATCHGDNGQKNALGVSKKLQNLSADKALDMLNGYKDGTYGGSKKTVMQMQVKRLSDAEMKAVAEYISTFK